MVQFQCLIALSKANRIWDSKLFLLFQIELMGCLYRPSKLVKVGPNFDQQGDSRFNTTFDRLYYLPPIDSVQISNIAVWRITRRVEPTKDLVNIPNINGDIVFSSSGWCLDILHKIPYIFYVGIKKNSRFADTCHIDQDQVRFSICALSKKCSQGLN